MVATVCSIGMGAFGILGAIGTTYPNLDNPANAQVTIIERLCLHRQFLLMPLIWLRASPFLLTRRLVKSTSYLRRFRPIPKTSW